MQPGPAQNEPELTPSSSTAEPAGRFVCMCMCVGVCGGDGKQGVLRLGVVTTCSVVPLAK